MREQWREGEMGRDAQGERMGGGDGERGTERWREKKEMDRRIAAAGHLIASWRSYGRGRDAALEELLTRRFQIKDLPLLLTSISSTSFYPALSPLLSSSHPSLSSLVL